MSQPVPSSDVLLVEQIELALADEDDDDPDETLFLVVTLHFLDDH